MPLHQFAVDTLARLGKHDRLKFLRPPDYPLQVITLKKLLNLYLARYHYARGHTRLFSYPTRLNIETTNSCNLRCPDCFTGAGQVGRDTTMMSVDFFKKVLEELGGYLFLMELHNWGEPLLNKNIYEMLALARRRGVSTLISTNFSIPFDRDRAETLVESGLVRLGVSLDGAHQDTYAKYRVRGDLERVLNNVRLVNEAKKKLQSQTPYMIWEFHVFAWNKEDIALARSMAQERDMEFALSKGWVVGPDWDPEAKYPFSPDLFSPGEAPSRCDYLWFHAVINNDSGVAPCCRTFYKEHDFGSTAAKPFREIWNNASYQDARRLFRVRRGDAKELICYECPMTVVWDDFKRHRAGGNSVASFTPPFKTNHDAWNYFWRQRPAPTRRGLGGGDDIELTPVARSDRAPR